MENTEGIIIGKNKEDNWKIFSEADPMDLWFHLDKFPSCYVILKGDYSKERIQLAAELCKNNTKYRNLKNVAVIYTEKSNLKKGTNVGEVIIKNNKKVKKIII
jgi:predicted ribosome quality control (RQC) complex YloA/Tae2 family protein